MKRRIVEKRNDFMGPKIFADRINPEDVIDPDHDALEVLKMGRKHPLYWEVWRELVEHMVVDDPEMGPSYVVDDGTGIWLVQINLGCNTGD